MSASTPLPVFTIFSGPTTANSLWNALRRQYKPYFIVRPVGCMPALTPTTRVSGVPTNIGTVRNDANVLNVRLGYSDELLCFDVAYNVAQRNGTIYCEPGKTRLEWLGLCFDIVEPLTRQKIYTIGDVLNYDEASVCQALLEDLMGYPMNNEAAQRAVGRFCRLRERLQMLNPEIQFRGGTHREDDLFMSAF